MSQDKKYINTIDIARIVAALAIVLIHLTVEMWSYKGLNWGYGNWLLIVFFNTMTRWGTPLFVMISGFVFLVPEKKRSPREFYRKRLSKILIPLIFWQIFYAVFRLVDRFDPATVKTLVNDIWWGGTHYHLYFLFAIGGLYLWTPLLNKWLAKKPNLNVIVPLMLLATFGWVIANNWKGLWRVNILTWWIPFLGYYLAGHWVGNWKVKLSPKILTIVVPLVLGAVFLITRKTAFRFGSDDKGIILAHRFSPFIAMASMVIFRMIIQFDVYFRWVKGLSELTFGVYLIHLAVIVVLRRLSWLGLDWAFVPALIVNYTVSIVASFGIVYLLKRVPFLRRVV